MDRVEQTNLLEEIVSVAKQMFRAEEEYGTGFYNEDDWIEAYKRLEQLVEYKRKQEQ